MNAIAKLSRSTSMLPGGGTRSPFVRKSDHARWMIAAAFILGAIALAAILIGPYAANLTFGVMLWGSVGVAWALSGGLAGRLSIGHAAFFGLGGYVTVLLLLRLGISPIAGLFVGACLAGLLAMAVEAVTGRMPTLFFALTTFALAQIFLLVARGWSAVTNGSEGLFVSPVLGSWNLVFENPSHYVGLAAAVLFIVLFCARWVTLSRHGYLLRAIREDPVAAEASGINTYRYRIYVAGLSGALTAIAGGVSALYILYIDPDTAFEARISLQAALVAIIGGRFTLYGPVAGAALMVLTERLLTAQFGSYGGGLTFLILGPVLILVVFIMPDGIVPRLKRAARKLIGGAQT